ncbi:MAG: hypothetical protein OZ921_16500 [Sorangiineae bacterium]|nr:hypothetical protein [Polyangiaceae bacterium]MEB2324115.1 hypothetical protein [Sorangiineae bacterium]
MSRRPSRFLEQLLTVHRYGGTGVLTVRAEQVTTYVYLLKGTPVFAEEGTLGETLGRLLVRRGALSEEQYLEILARMTDSLFSNEQLRFGEVASLLGYLTLEQINEALAMQVREKIVHCMQWEDAECEYVPNVAALSEVARYPCRVDAVVLEGLRRYYDRARVAGAWSGDQSLRPALGDAPTVLAARYEASPEERAVLERLDGRSTLAELAELGLVAERLLTALIVTGGVTLHATEEEARRACSGAGRVRVPAGVLARARQEPPAAESAPEVEPGQKPVPASRQVPPATRVGEPRIVEAPPSPQLPDRAARPPLNLPRRARPSVPPPLDEQRDRLRAEQSFQSGKRNLRAGVLGTAAEELAKAAELHPSAIEYQLYATWARFRLARDPSAAQELREQLARLALACVRQDQNLAFAHYVFARVRLLEGDERSALKSFRIAHKLDPNDVDALRHVRLLTRRAGG